MDLATYSQIMNLQLAYQSLLGFMCFFTVCSLPALVGILTSLLSEEKKYLQARNAWVDWSIALNSLSKADYHSADALQ